MEQLPSRWRSCNWKSDLPAKDIAKWEYAVKQLSETDPFIARASVTGDIDEVTPPQWSFGFAQLSYCVSAAPGAAVASVAQAG